MKGKNNKVKYPLWCYGIVWGMRLLFISLMLGYIDITYDTFGWALIHNDKSFAIAVLISGLGLTILFVTGFVLMWSKIWEMFEVFNFEK